MTFRLCSLSSYQRQLQWSRRFGWRASARRFSLARRACVAVTKTRIYSCQCSECGARKPAAAPRYRWDRPPRLLADLCDETKVNQFLITLLQCFSFRLSYSKYLCYFFFVFIIELYKTRQEVINVVETPCYFFPICQKEKLIVNQSSVSSIRKSDKQH